MHADWAAGWHAPDRVGCWAERARQRDRVDRRLVDIVSFHRADAVVLDLWRTRGQEPIHRHVSGDNVLKRGGCDTCMQKVSRKRQESMRAHVLHIDCMAPGLHEHNVTCARLRQICRAAASGEARTCCHYARYGHGRGRMQCQEPWNIFEQRPTHRGGEARRPWGRGKCAPTALKRYIRTARLIVGCGRMRSQVSMSTVMWVMSQFVPKCELKFRDAVLITFATPLLGVSFATRAPNLVPPSILLQPARHTR